MGRSGGGPDAVFPTSSHRLGQRSLLSILSSMLSDSWILLPTLLPKRLRGDCCFMFKVVVFQEACGGNIDILVTTSLSHC